MNGSLPPAALLAGGLGTRIRSLAGNVPKVLLPVEGRPFLAHLLEYVAGQGVEKTVLCLGHGADIVWDAAQSHAPSGLRLVESRENEPRGTAGAAHDALPRLGPTFFLLNGDTYFRSPLSRLLERHREAGARITLSLVRSEDMVEKGTVRVDPGGRVLRFDEKITDGTGLINGGVYVIEAGVLAGCATDRPVSLEREVIPGVLAGGGIVHGCVVDAPFVDIGLPEDYLRVRDRLPKGGTRP